MTKKKTVKKKVTGKRIITGLKGAIEHAKTYGDGAQNGFKQGHDEGYTEGISTGLWKGLMWALGIEFLVFMLVAAIFGH